MKTNVLPKVALKERGPTLLYFSSIIIIHVSAFPEPNGLQNDDLCELPSPSPVETKVPSKKRSHRIRMKLKRNKTCDSIKMSQQQLPLDQPKAKKTLFGVGGATDDSITSSHSSSTSSLKGADSVTVNGYEASSPLSPLAVNSISMNSLPFVDVGDEPSLRIGRKESLAQVFQEKLDTETNEADEAEGKQQLDTRERN